ncbi:FAD binding domain protein [Aspergillus sclerotialis]|uniref:FAD binding domain protein n=1 Tax=Aspergillus sclerotialis TaxID=2070753 RepID=A0A3A2ZVF2_9EURO|nr:FAD binding domain protein [Aspergillus sclerotialis]
MAGFTFRLLWSGLSLLTVHALAASIGKPSAATVCEQLYTLQQNNTVLHSQPQYGSLSTENWSETAWANPTCIVQPANVVHLQEVVRLLSQKNVQFAIRSGGHLPSPLGANINNGVLIDMSLFSQLHYHPDKRLATIGPALKWGEVYEALAEHGMTAVGGRILDVGVGGLILGSGLSYLSDLYGLACDNVVNFEVVLANGSLVNANAKSNPDLFWALKGGANNFGIVTAFTVRTYPIGKVWGGIKLYSLDQLPTVLAAFDAYQSVPDKDPYANLMIQAAPTNASVGVLVNLVYLKPESSPAAFRAFYDIPTLADSTKIQSFNEFMAGGVMPNIARWDWHATSFTPSSSFYSNLSTLMTTAPEIKEISSLNTGTLVLGLQPISTSLIAAGQARGSNALGLIARNQTWLVLDVGWQFSSDDDAAHMAGGKLKDRIERMSVTSGNYVDYIFMNDASWDQDVLEHYGPSNVARLRQTRATYDPTAVFQRLVPGGFKLGV